MQQLELQDVCNEESFGEFFSAFFCRSGQTLTRFDMDIAESYLKIDDEEQALVLLVQGINLQYDFGFKIWSEPEFISDEGDGQFIISKTSLMITLKPIEQDGVLQVNFSDVKINIGDYQVTLDGSTDLSDAVEIMFTNFKQILRQEVSQMLAWRFTKSIEKTLNMLITSNGEYIDLSVPMSSVPQHVSYLNATLMQNPIFNKGFISFAIDGSFVYSGANGRLDNMDEEVADFPLMPVFVGD